MDLGSGERRLREEVVNLDVVPSPLVDVVADGHRLPFPEGAFDAIILQSVIEHVREPELMIAESARVLKKGGVLWVEAPFLYPVHDESDYYRWTVQGLQHVVSKHLEVTRYGILMGPSAALSLGWRSYLMWKLRNLHWGVRNAAAWATTWLKLIDGDEASLSPEAYALSFVVGTKV